MYLKASRIKLCLDSKVLVSVIGHSVIAVIYNFSLPYLVNISFDLSLIIVI